MQTIVAIIALVSILLLTSVSIALIVNNHVNSSLDKKIVIKIINDKNLYIKKQILADSSIQKILNEFKIKDMNISIAISDIKKISDNKYTTTVLIRLTPTFYAQARILVDIKTRTLELIGKPMVVGNITYMKHVFSATDAALARIEDLLAKNSSTFIKTILQNTTLSATLAENNINIKQVLKETIKLAQNHALFNGFALDPVTGKVKYYYITIILMQLNNNSRTKWIIINPKMNTSKLVNFSKICKKIINIQLMFKLENNKLDYLGYIYRIYPCIYFSPPLKYKHS